MLIAVYHFISEYKFIIISCFPFSITDLEYGNKSRKKKAYNLRTRKLQPVFDSDSDDDFQAPSMSGNSNKGNFFPNTVKSRVLMRVTNYFLGFLGVYRY